MNCSKEIKFIAAKILPLLPKMEDFAFLPPMLKKRILLQQQLCVGEEYIICYKPEVKEVSHNLTNYILMSAKVGVNFYKPKKEALKIWKEITGIVGVLDLERSFYRDRKNFLFSFETYSREGGIFITDYKEDVLLQSLIQKSLKEIIETF